MEIKFLSSTGLSKFLQRLYEVFSQVGHTHMTSQITDLPVIPSKESQLTNDEGFITNHDLPERFYVSISSDFTANKTFTEIKTAYNNNQDVWCIFGGMSFPMTTITENGALFTILLEGLEQNIYIDASTVIVGQTTYVTTDELPTTLPNPNAITINGVSYDGSSSAEVSGLATIDDIQAYVDSAILGGAW